MKRIEFCAAVLLALALAGAPATLAAPEGAVTDAAASASATATAAAAAVEVRVERTVRALTEPLGLTGDQGVRLRPVLVRHQQAVQELRERWTASDAGEAEARAGFRADLLELRAGLRQELAGILTPDQIDRFEELRRENRRRGAAALEPE